MSKQIFHHLYNDTISGVHFIKINECIKYFYREKGFSSINILNQLAKTEIVFVNQNKAGCSDWDSFCTYSEIKRLHKHKEKLINEKLIISSLFSYGVIYFDARK